MTKVEKNAYGKVYRQRNRERIAQWKRDHRDRIRETQRQWYLANPGKNREYKRKEYLRRREILLARNREWQKKNKEHKNEYSRRWYASHPDARLRKSQWSKEKVKELRDAVLKAYGEVCFCCGESCPDFLTVGHINGRENVDHPKDLTGWRMYSWLVKHNFPKKDFRLECWNCNCARARLGYCPHERLR